MEHKIDVHSIEMPQAEVMSHAISTCVHCGFCLPTCPTYQVLGEEMDSPRGRIVLMRGVLENNLPLEQATPYLDRCLGCLACVTSCPSGVPYGELISSFRAYAEDKRERPIVDRISRTMTSQTLPFPNRFRWAAAMGNLAKPFAAIFPAPIRAMLGLVPSSLPPSQTLPEFSAAKGTRRGQVGLLLGCVQQAIAPEINSATVRVLNENGYDVVIPRGQGCCGALGMHTGDSNAARKLAAVNFDRFPEHLDAIITNAAGCGSGMKEYPLLFLGTRLEDKASQFARRIRDISEFLGSIELVTPQPLAKPMRVAYHDACHLAHAQGITSAPRKILGQIPGLIICEIPDGEICCGSAGTYNIEQPKIANTLGELKAKHIVGLGVDAVALGNIGCMVQIQNHLAKLDPSRPAIPVLHTIQLLDQAYCAARPQMPYNAQRQQAVSLFPYQYDRLLARRVSLETEPRFQPRLKKWCWVTAITTLVTAITMLATGWRIGSSELMVITVFSLLSTWIVASILQSRGRFRIVSMLVMCTIVAVLVSVFIPRMRIAAAHRRIAAAVLRAGGSIEFRNATPRAYDGWITTNNGLVIPELLAPVFEYLEGGEIDNLFLPASCVTMGFHNGAKFSDHFRIELKLDVPQLDYQSLNAFIRESQARNILVVVIGNHIEQAELEFLQQYKNKISLEFRTETPSDILYPQDFQRALLASPRYILLSGNFQIVKEQWSDVKFEFPGDLFLSIRAGRYGSTLFEALEGCKFPIKLGIYGGLTDEAWRTIGKLEGVTNFTCGTNATDQQFRCLTHLKNLKQLSFYETSLSEETLKEIAKIGTLEEISLPDTTSAETVRCFLRENPRLSTISGCEKLVRRAAHGSTTIRITRDEMQRMLEKLEAADSE